MALNDEVKKFTDHYNDKQTDGLHTSEIEKAEILPPFFFHHSPNHS